MRAADAWCATGQPCYFDTLRLELPVDTDAMRQRALEAGINFEYIDDRTVGTLNETVDTRDLRDIVNVFAAAIGKHRASRKPANW